MTKVLTDNPDIILTSDVIKNNVLNVKEDYKYKSDAISNIQNKTKNIHISGIKTVEPGEATDLIKEYHRTLANIQIRSKNLVNIAEVLIKETLPIQQGKKYDNGFWKKIKDGLDSITNKIKYIEQTFYGSVKIIWNSLSQCIEALKASFEKGINAIEKAFRNVSEKFQELILEIIMEYWDSCPTYEQL
jgi:predicted nucleic acid-binding protein